MADLITSTLRLWHGGAPDLRVGQLIEPRPHTDQRHLIAGCAICEARRRGEQHEDDDNDPTFVYLTTDREYARMYAAGYPRGALYRVEPVGELVALSVEQDPRPSWAAPAARVLAVYDACVTMTRKETLKRLAGYWRQP